MSSKRTPKVSKSLTAKGHGAFGWALGKIAYGKNEDSRRHNGTKVGKKKCE